MQLVKKHRGFALQEALVLCSCAALFIAIATVVCATPGDDVKNANSRHPLSLKDQLQLESITNAFTVFAKMQKGRYPIPGLINRKAADIDGDGKGDMQLTGVGPEDIALNTTANLYSAMIAQRYFNPDILISPIERNKKVMKDLDYEFEAFNPANDQYWDSKFAADLKKLSNTSYAHIPLFGQSKMRIWKFNKDSPSPILSNRGPNDGKADPKSNTCGPHGFWHGNVAFSDLHVEFLGPTTPAAVPLIKNNNGKLDNIFSGDDMGGNDIVLAFTKVMKELKDGGPELQYD